MTFFGVQLPKKFQLISYLGLATVASGLIVTASAAALAVVRSFNAKTALPTGEVVAISPIEKDTVEPAPAKDPSRIYGVVVDQNTPPVVVEKPNQKVFVATSDVYLVLVNDDNGPINNGDYLSMSSKDGVAARNRGSQFVVGQALEAYNSKGEGKIKARITPGKSAKAAVPEGLQTFSESVAGKPVSAVRTYLAIFVFLLAALIAAILLTVGIRSSMIAIGRNPLSRHSIMRNLMQVVLASALVFIAGLFGLYLLLRI